MNVLIVDDNQSAAELLQELILLEKHEVVCAFTVKQALEVGTKEGADFAMAFIDLTLPDGHGSDVARVLREQARAQGKNVVLVAISGYSAQDPAGQQAAPFVDHFLQKPIDFDELDRLLAATAASVA